MFLARAPPNILPSGTSLKHASKACMDILVAWQRSLLTWLANITDEVVLRLFLNSTDSQDQAPPALTNRQNKKRKYVQISTLAKWKILKRSRELRISAGSVLAVQSSDAHVQECNPRAARLWMMQEQELYKRRTVRALTGQSVNHFNLVSDPAHHSYKDYLTSYGNLSCRANICKATHVAHQACPSLV